MSIETLQNQYHVEEYVVDQDGYSRRRSEAEMAAIKRDMELKDFLNRSTLSVDDMQHLRDLSAEYAIVSTPLPETDVDHKSMVREYLLSDLPRATQGNIDGLRQVVDPEHGPTVTIDGNPLSTDEFGHIYTLIEPSLESLDRAVEESAYFYTPSLDEEPVVKVEHVDNKAQSVVHKPIPDEAYSLREGMRPITDKLIKHIGGKVISLFNTHHGIEDKKHHSQHHIKIAS